MSKPITRNLLVHSIIFNSFIERSSWGVDTFGANVSVKYVRVENVKKTLLNSMGDGVDDKALMFVDAKNSSPVVSYKKEDKITFNGFDYRIREIAEIYGDNNKLHHLEIRLV